VPTTALFGTRRRMRSVIPHMHHDGPTPVFRRCAHRSESFTVLLLATMSCSLVVALPGCGGPSETRGAQAHAPSTAGSTYTLLQMNLCLSGYGGCNGKAEYPDSVEEAVAR